jgi:two-component system, OmpR family, response regulator
MKQRASILLVEDDKNLGFVIKDFLCESEYEVELAENGIAALSLFSSKYFDLCLIDIMLPLKDGFTVAEEIRQKNSQVPIIFVTARAMKEDRIRGFKIGADDYITKPFSIEELVLRIEAILRRTRLTSNSIVEQEVYNIGQFVYDYSNQTISFNEDIRKLTKKESEVLRLLCINKNRLVRRDFALKLIWGEDDYFMGRSMDVYITKLRKILKRDPSITIQNIHRTGFMLEVEE